MVIRFRRIILVGVCNSIIHSRTAIVLEADQRVNSAAELEGFLEEVLLLEAGAGAGRLPGVLPTALSVVSGALDVAPVLLQAWDVDNLPTTMYTRSIYGTQIRHELSKCDTYIATCIPF
jgi:hypothetical protein